MRSTFDNACHRDVAGRSPATDTARARRERRGSLARAATTRPAWLAASALLLIVTVPRPAVQASPAQSSQAGQSAQQPTSIAQTKFDSGQDIVPVYEGWVRNSDGSFDLVFGYFNRNFKEELSIPPGASNSVEPGGPDRGQPTYFLPRRRPRLFRVRVPADWGNKVLTWSITANGRTEKAYGDLLAVEEINEHIIMSGGNNVLFGDPDPNEPPTITVPPAASVSVGQPLTLTASVTDDGLPKPRVQPARRAATAGSDGAIQRQTNGLETSRPRGLSVTWFQYGGPGRVAFDPAGAVPVANGAASAKATFAAPGTYTLIATATDGQLSQRASVTVTVSGSSTASGKPRQ
jgi:hypothetical protein